MASSLAVPRSTTTTTTSANTNTNTNTAAAANRTVKTTLKRPAPGPLAAERHTKLRRTSRRSHMDQRRTGNGHANNAHANLTARWISFSIDGFKLVYETISQFLPGGGHSNNVDLTITSHPPRSASSSTTPSPTNSIPQQVVDPSTLTPRTYLNNKRKKAIIHGHGHPQPHPQHPHSRDDNPHLIPLPPSPPSSLRQEGKRRSYYLESAAAAEAAPRNQPVYGNQVASSSRVRLVDRSPPYATTNTTTTNTTTTPESSSSSQPSWKRPRKSIESSPSVEIVSSNVGNPTSNSNPIMANGSGVSQTKPVVRAYKNREHIFAKQHKQRVQEERKASRLEMETELYGYERQRGYQSSLDDFRGLLSYRAGLERLQPRDILSPSSSLTDLRELSNPLSRNRRYSFADADGMFLQRALEKARATFNGPKPAKPFIPSYEQLQLRNRHVDEAIENRLRPKRPPVPLQLPPADDAKVNEILSKRGVVSKFERSQVSSDDLARLRPAQWLNDEIINFYGALLTSRSEGGGKENVKGGSGAKKIKAHYFNTFFWPKILEGYEKSRLAKWTKKASFLFAFGNAHWTSAAINFRKKRIEAYDSLGSDQTSVMNALRGYVDAEHRNKKKKPFDFTGWENYSPSDTPQQENAFDCGVFTCTILEYISRGEEKFDFGQKHMPYFRRRMILEIGTAQLRDQP
ncbi:hypothetical protein ONZ45_g14193 [Pleurotus djamor]|nr:hypothetical protein ONZ45_g14193 [Pleurotus djamor]